MDRSAIITQRGSIDTQGRIDDEENIGIADPPSPEAAKVNHDIKFEAMDLQQMSSI